ncbi:MAG: aminoacyl-tRNA hydrolase [Nitrospiraceae bacterium]|nr:aminoacyl-tRNA hydrolase [Nitrospiraceae bacterium]
MWIIAGLGNPGRKYSNTRHNIGFKAVDYLARELSSDLSEKDLYIIGKADISGSQAVLLKPLTYMNRSGAAVKKIMDKYYAAPENLIVVHDDLDLEAGVIKIRRGGSSGGHRGIESIINTIGSKDFIRVKIGISRDPSMLVEDYVLKPFGSEHKDLITDAVQKAAEAVMMIIADGAESAMNRFNRANTQNRD